MKQFESSFENEYSHLDDDERRYDIAKLIYDVVMSWNLKCAFDYANSEDINEICFDIDSIGNDNYKEYNRIFDLLTSLCEWCSYNDETNLVGVSLACDISMINEENYNLLSQTLKYNL